MPGECEFCIFRKNTPRKAEIQRRRLVAVLAKWLNKVFPPELANPILLLLKFLLPHFHVYFC
jgi:hypothetical protein